MRVSIHKFFFFLDGKNNQTFLNYVLIRYVGEIITDFEADQREDDSYLFDLDNKVKHCFFLLFSHLEK